MSQAPIADLINDTGLFWSVLLHWRQELIGFERIDDEKQIVFGLQSSVPVHGAVPGVGHEPDEFNRFTRIWKW